MKIAKEGIFQLLLIRYVLLKTIKQGREKLNHCSQKTKAVTLTTRTVRIKLILNKQSLCWWKMKRSTLLELQPLRLRFLIIKRFLATILIYLGDHGTASYFWPVYSCTRTINLRILSEYKKIRTRNNSIFRHFSRSVRFWNFWQTRLRVIRYSWRVRSDELDMKKVLSIMISMWQVLRDIFALTLSLILAIRFFQIQKLKYLNMS